MIAHRKSQLLKVCVDTVEAMINSFSCSFTFVAYLERAIQQGYKLVHFLTQQQESSTASNGSSTEEKVDLPVLVARFSARMTKLISRNMRLLTDGPQPVAYKAPTKQGKSKQKHSKKGFKHKPKRGPKSREQGQAKGTPPSSASGRHGQQQGPA